MESTIILKTDAHNALVAAHRLMQEMSSRSQPSAESAQFQRGFSAAISTIATVFGLDQDVCAPTLTPASDWRLADEHPFSIPRSQTDALDWPRPKQPESTLVASERR